MRSLRAICLCGLLLALPAASSGLPIRVVMIGDSITVGAVAGGGTPYAALLAEQLGPGYELHNVACNGSSSLDWTVSQGVALCGGAGFFLPDIYRGRAQPELPAEIVTIMLGTNDATGFFEPAPVSVEAYGAAMAEIVSNVLADGALYAVLMTPPLLPGKPFASLRAVGYREEIFALCDGVAQVVCGPDVLTLLDEEGIRAGDVHPTAVGHAQIAVALAETLTGLAVPEPGGLPLVVGGLAVLAVGRRRQMRAAGRAVRK